MDDLPNEMLLEIFLRLPVDQMLLCKQVCKRWFAVIDAPKLERFRYEKTFFRNVIVKHPESIKEFYSFFISYDRTAVWLDFVNLEHLYCKKYLHNEQLLLRLKHLKTFHVNVYSGNMNYFKMQKAALGLNNPQIYFQGVHLDALPLYSEVPFDWNKFGTRLDAGTIEFHASNDFQFVDRPYNMRMVDWYLLESYFEEHHFAAAPIELVRRFVRLDELELSGEPRDPEQLANLLRHCKYLPSLKVTASFMSQSFFDEILSEHCPVIGSLSLQNENQLNFDFLLKFKDLQNLTTDQLLSTDLVAKMYDRFEYLNTLRFRFKGSSVEIRFYERTTFRLLLNKTRHLFDNLASLLQFLELNHNQEPLNIEENLNNFIIRSF